jgi:hypothetical protein
MKNQSLKTKTMKNVFLFIIAILVLGSCAKNSAVQEPNDPWNGYSQFHNLKACTLNHGLWAACAKNDTLHNGTKVGNVSYAIDEDVNGTPSLHVQYNTTASGWMIKETHCYAGLLKLMPLTNAKDTAIGNPKVGKFNYCGNHGSQGVSVVDYWIPLTALPPYTTTDPTDVIMVDYGFAIASHCVVTSPSGQTETGWAYGSNRFNDKGWGWYDKYFEPYQKPNFTVLYGTSCTDGLLKLYHLNMSTGVTTLILEENVGNTAGTYDGAAFDEASDLFFFVNYNTRQLYVNYMGDADPSFPAGYLNGTAASGTFYNGAFYYVNPDFNTINKVTFTSTWMIASETVLDEIPETVTINDITMDPTGNYLYLVGEVNNGGTEMIKYDIAADTYYTIALSLNSGSQIAFGSDEKLYAIEPVTEEGGTAAAYIVNPNTGVLTEVDEGHIIIIDGAITDLSRGPSM